MQVLPRRDVAALQIDVFTKESGIHKEQTGIRNANIELSLLCFAPYGEEALKMSQGAWDRHVTD
jgi:hypothetical protein